MKISYSWLKQYLELELSPEKLAELLTGCGLEVESTEKFSPVKGGLKGVVTGEVLSCTKHPDSDHLTLTTVDVGAAEPLKIVCGAPNVAAGQKVAVALIGTTLYFKDKELTLQKTRIRGEVSEGMICAEDELGLGDDHSGILVLDPSAKKGTPAAEYFRIEEDTVFTIGLTPNRIDAASHVGVARDVAAVLNNFGKSESGTGKKYRLRLPDVSAFKQDNSKLIIDISVEDPKACPRYTGLTVTGIIVKDSPDWLKNKMLAVGLRPINNIVDITNFILMELGQPLHAFDAEHITGKKVEVKKYPEGTKFITLDEVERELGKDDLMICNTAEPMCIAGVFGGIKSGVTRETTSVFLESAYFDPVHVRKTARKHGLSTDASFRFERGADYNITIYAIKRAALLIKEIAGGEISSPVIDIYPEPLSSSEVHLSWFNLDSLIGKKLDRKVVSDILTDIGIEIKQDDRPNQKVSREKGLDLIIPSFKVDVTRDVDVIEEVLRIYGYNNVEILSEVRSSLSYTIKPDPDKIRNMISDYLSAHGFFEIMNNSLTRSAYYIDNPDFQCSQCVKILNPISRDLDVMRQSLLFGALESVVYNQNRKIPGLKMFEFGTVYRKTSADNGLVKGYHEETRLCILLTGRSEPENWNSNPGPVDWFELKGYTDAIFRKLGIISSRAKNIAGISGISLLPLKNYSVSQGANFVLNGNEIGWAGQLSRNVLNAFDIRQDVLYADFNCKMILSLVSPADIQYQELPKFPEVRRDLALMVDKSVRFAEIEKLAYETERNLLKKVGLFDVYEGEKIESGKKSYALSFILQDELKTLTDKEIDNTMERLVKAFGNKLNAQVR
jgi:phenylalanyl-tRNA synthetase beta chain